MPLATIPLALAGGSLAIIIFLVVFFFVIVFAYYTRRGSGIEHHPSDGRAEAPGAGGPGVMSKGRTPEDPDSGGDDPISTHGTR